MAQTVEQALRAAAFFSDGQRYALAKLPPAGILAAAGVIAEIGEPFCALIADKDEVTVIIPAEAWDDFAGRLPGHELNTRQYRLITLDVPLEPDLIGFMARVSAALAAAGVSILPLAAYTRDHLLVSDDQFEKALSALERLKANS